MQHVPAAAPAPDSIRAVLTRVFSAREYRWSTRFDPLAWIREQLARISDWLDALRHAHPVAYVVLLLVLIGLFALIVVHLVWLMRRAMRGAVLQSGLAPGARTTRDAAWHLAEARRLGEQGRYREAVGERFIALALELDHRDVVRFHPSKTPGEYVREARLQDAERGRLRALVFDLYRYLFGGVACTGEAWSAFDAAAVSLGGVSAAR